MKNKTLIIIFTIICSHLFFSEASSAQNTISESTISKPVKSKELIIGIPKMTDKTLLLFSNAIGQIHGMTYDTYCPKDKLVLITYDSKVFPRSGDVIDAIKNTDFNLQMFIKEGTFSEVKQNCSEN